VNEKIHPNHVEIQNVVAVATLNQKIDLLAIMEVFRNVEHRPKKFPGLVFRLKRPKTATLIFTTGKMVCTGARSEKEAFGAVRKVVRELRKEGFIIQGRPKIEIVNIVGTADFGGEVDLESMADILDDIMYEPEMFPGLIYRMKYPKVVILIFRSGKIVLTGANREEQVHEVADKMRSILVENGLLY
jgi:transcription initiation factor TFIID TATA-box-binding protein